MKGSPADRAMLNTLFDDLARHGFGAAELSPLLAAPAPAVERELRRTHGRRVRPPAAGRTPMIAFPDTSDAWGSIGDLALGGSSSFSRPLPPWKFEGLAEARRQAETAAWETDVAA